MKKNLLLLLLGCSLFSCSKDDDITNDIAKGDILVSTRIPNADGTSGSAYMQLVNKLVSQTTNNKTALPTSYSVPPVVLGKEVYTLPGFSMQSDFLRKYKWENGQLLEEAHFTLPAQSGAVSIVKTGNKAYVSMCYLGKVLILDTSKMEKIGEIDLSEYGVGDKNPDPSIMLIRDGLLYVGLSQMVGGYSPSPNRPKADVIIIDTTNDKVLKMITNSSAQFSMPTKPEADEKSIFMDENKDIYINCISGFGSIGHKAGLLRIKAGETEFDNTYDFDVTNTPVDGEPNPLAYLIHIDYDKNGKLYATANINQYYSNPPDYMKDHTVISLELDIYNKTIKKLNFPMSTNFGASVNIVDDQVLFGLSTSTGNGYYIYNKDKKTCSKDPVIKITGFPESICKIK